MKRPIRPARYPHVAICVDQFRAHGRGVLRGIARYVETYGPWSLFIDPLADSNYPKGRSENWHGDGILTYIESRERAERLRQSRIPTVELFAYRQDNLLPLVAHDDLAVGRVAALHFVERHYRHFAFSGYAQTLWSERRYQGFAETAVSSGCETTHCLPVERPSTLVAWERVQQQLTDWVKALPKPVGLMACSDHHAQRILDACQRAGLVVPEEVAVIGVDNDEEICRLSNPPLSSVILDGEQVGYEGAALLDTLLRGRRGRADRSRVLIPPLGVATRRSTEASAIADPLVAQALRLIRERACEGLTVEQLLSALHISRSVFYQRFHSVLGSSPHAEILRAQLARAKNLLRQTNLPLKTISEMAGFHSPNYLSVVFKRETGMTPGDYHRHPNGE